MFDIVFRDVDAFANSQLNMYTEWYAFRSLLDLMTSLAHCCQLDMPL